MAEIKIEKKKAIWPWVLLILVILAAVCYFLFYKNDNSRSENPVAMADSTAILTSEQLPAISAYATYIDVDTAAMSLDHTFTHNALLKLIDATEATASKQNFNIKADLDKAREDAGKITVDPLDTQHADFIKDATTRISTALQNMQQAKFPQLASSAQAVKNASNAISTSDLTLDQKLVIKKYFGEAADLLKKMN